MPNSSGPAKTGITPDISVLGFGSPSGGAQVFTSAGGHFFTTGMTPGHGGTPLSEIKTPYDSTLNITGYVFR